MKSKIVIETIQTAVLREKSKKKKKSNDPTCNLSLRRKRVQIGSHDIIADENCKPTDPRNSNFKRDKHKENLARTYHKQITER